MATYRESESSFIVARTVVDDTNYCEVDLADVFAALVEGGSENLGTILMNTNVIQPVMRKLGACLGQPYQWGRNALSGVRVETSTAMRACEQKLRQQLREDCVAAAASYLPTPIATEPGYLAMLAAHIWLGFMRISAEMYDDGGGGQEFNYFQRGDTLWAACNSNEECSPGPS